MTKRCFIAINLAEQAKTELEKLITGLKKVNSNRLISYVKPAAIHLTLHFLGDLDSEQIDKVKNVLADTVPSCQKTELITGEIGAFPNLSQPRVIFLASQEQTGDSLIRLQKNLGKELEKIGLKIDHRSWHPHLTLARIKGPCQFATQDLQPLRLKIPVESIELMESQLSLKGAEYKILASYDLRN